MSSRTFTVLLADDDLSQLAYLAALVERLRPQWKIVSHATSGTQVATDLARLNPTLAILDIRFADATAIEIVKGLRESLPVIFVTGDPLFAAEAFSCDAIDFVLKPISSERLEHALRKAEATIVAKDAGSEKAERAVSSLRMIRGRDLVWTPLSEVRFFEAQRKYTRVVLKDQEGLLKMGINIVSQYLQANQFWRIHRSIILNVSHMASARHDEMGRLIVSLLDRNERLTVSRPYEHLFKDGFS